MNAETIPSGWGFPPRSLRAAIPATNHTPPQTALAIAYWLGSRCIVPSTAEIRTRFGLTDAAARGWRKFGLQQAQLENQGDNP